MPSDNVTPFRRPPRRPPSAPQQQGGMGFKTHRGKAILVHVLTMASFAAPFLVGASMGSLVGLGLAVAAGVIAYTSRFQSMPWAATHHEQALRTLLIAFALTTALLLPTLVIPRSLVSVQASYGVFYFWGSIAVLIWAGLRALIGLVLAGLRKPVPNPKGWLI
jgi:uncharacterized membrane protein